MPRVTPRPQAQAMLSWAPMPPATTWATTPTPNRIRMKVPKNSEISSPANPGTYGLIAPRGASSLISRPRGGLTSGEPTSVLLIEPLRPVEIPPARPGLPGPEPDSRWTKWTLTQETVDNVDHFS